MTAIGRKYGMLVVPTRRDDGRSLELAPGRSWFGRVADVVEKERISHWRTWLGSVRWEEMIERKRRLVMIAMDSSRPDVLDDENETLSGELHLIWRALLLAGPVDPLAGEAWFFSGEADASGAGLHGLRSHGTLGPIARPFYTSRKAFWRAFPRRAPDDWLGRWGALSSPIYARLTRRCPRPCASRCSPSRRLIGTSQSSFDCQRSSERPKPCSRSRRT